MGAFSSEREQLLVGIAGTVISLGFSLYAEMRTRTKIKAAAAASDTRTLMKLALRN